MVVVVAIIDGVKAFMPYSCSIQKMMIIIIIRSENENLKEKNKKNNERKRRKMGYTIVSRTKERSPENACIEMNS